MLQGTLTPEQSALLDSADQSITELPSLNQALVTGGINSAGQILKSATFVKSSSASITTDKNDYEPGQIVTITGSGFQPKEQVDIYFHEFPEEYPDIFSPPSRTSRAIFQSPNLLRKKSIFGRVFTLTAIGGASGFTAQTAFKDARLNTINVAGQNPNPVSAGSNATFTVTVGFNGNATSCTVDLSISGLPVGASFVSFSQNPVTGSGVAGVNSILTISTNAALAGGTHPFTVTAATRSGCQNHPASLTGNANLVVAQTFSVTFNATPISDVPNGTTVLSVTIGAGPSTAVTKAELPKTFNNIASGTNVSYSYVSPLAASATKQYRWISTSGTGNASAQTGQTGSFNITSNSTVSVST